MEHGHDEEGPLPLNEMDLDRIYLIGGETGDFPGRWMVAVAGCLAGCRVGGAEVGRADVGVDLRGAHIGVTQLFLHGADIVAAGQRNPALTGRETHDADGSYEPAAD